VPNRPDVAVRLVPLKLRFRHLAIPVSMPRHRYALERVKGIEPSS
jgi:hypothetical protein